MNFPRSIAFHPKLGVTFQSMKLKPDLPGILLLCSPNLQNTFHACTVFVKYLQSLKLPDKGTGFGLVLVCLLCAYAVHIVCLYIF